MNSDALEQSITKETFHQFSYRVKGIILKF